jgi:ribosomal-protein-alanine acetyltransferase
VSEWAELLVRRAGIGDHEAIVRIARAAIAEAWSESALRHELARALTQCFIAELGGREAGFLLAWRIEDEAEVLLIATAPWARRRGVGRSLIAALEAGGPRIVHLEVRVSNHGARAFYEALGFESVGRRPKYYVDTGEDAIRMSHRVSAP